MKTKIDIISGFLGAGKTTLIKKLLEEKLCNEKLVIIENEFGQVGIDGKLLQRPNIEVREINSGCICCTLMGDFEKALEEVIVKYKPDRIIIEPSGVGKLSDVLKACDVAKLKELLAVNMVIAAVDVLKYQIYIANFGEFYEDQIKNARTVILSRTQKADDKKLEMIVDSIRKLNNSCSIITTPWESLSAETILRAAAHDTANSLESQLKKAVLDTQHHTSGCTCSCGHEHGHDQASSACRDSHAYPGVHSHSCSHTKAHSHNADEAFDVWGVETPGKFDANELEKILDKLGDSKAYGMVLRGKGIIQLVNGKWIQFDYVPGEYEFKDINPDYTGRLCIIGSDLKKGEICKLFQVRE